MHMHGINHTLDQKILEADGRYLDAQGLSPLEQYLQGYANRMETYQQLRDHSKTLVTQALQRLGQVYPELVQKHGSRCQYDMSEVLRYIALSILRDDEVFFNEQMMSWLDTILVAYKQHKNCSVAYGYLQEAVNAKLSPNCSAMVKSYLDGVIQLLQSHA
jgi:hypothetical protein